MDSPAQRALLTLYRGVRRTRLLDTPAGAALFETAYELYKAALEAGPVGQLRRLVPPGSLVVDVGANVGFFTRRFARWVGPAGRVLALEPEPRNVARLEARLRRENLHQIVGVIAAAATEAAGTAWLDLNPDNPADHRLGDNGIAVPTVTVDDLVGRDMGRPVSLIKIDVQGSELRVIAGAAATIARFTPALFVEVDDQHLRAGGASASALVERLDTLGYAPHRLLRRGLSPALSPMECLARVERPGQYEDFVFLPRGRDGASR
jgi:FkbM family methyltransferase